MPCGELQLLLPRHPSQQHESSSLRACWRLQLVGRRVLSLTHGSTWTSRAWRPTTLAGVFDGNGGSIWWLLPAAEVCVRAYVLDVWQHHQ